MVLLHLSRQRQRSNLTACLTDKNFNMMKLLNIIDVTYTHDAMSCHSYSDLKFVCSVRLDMRDAGARQ